MSADEASARPSGFRAGLRALGGGDFEDRAFRVAAALALGLHAWIGWRLRGPGLRGGGDLVMHLALFERFRIDPGLHNPYPPFYHLLGALFEPGLGADAFTRAFAFAAALALVFAARSFQRAAALPATAAALFVLTPYVLAYSYCTPKVEALGYALLLFGLGRLLRRRYVAFALALAAAFWVHMASSLLFAIAAGVVVLARRDARGLAALAAGVAGYAPALAAHLAAGCSVAEAFLFTPAGYALRDAATLPAETFWRALPLANPWTVGAGALGALALWRRDRALAALAAALVALYANPLWLAPFGVGSVVNWTRGVPLLALAAAIAAGVWAGGQRGRVLALVGAAGAWALASPALWFDDACHVARLDVDAARAAEVDRCRLVWSKPGAGRAILAGKPSDGLVFVTDDLDIARARISDGAVLPVIETPDRLERWPVWSVAARRLLFQAGPQRGNERLLVFDVRETSARPLTDAAAPLENWAAWSPNGRRVAFVFWYGAGETSSGLALARVANGGRRVLLPNEPGARLLRPAWSADGRLIVVERGGEASSSLWLVALDGTAVPLTDPSAAGLHDRKPRFTRDAAGVVFQRDSGEERDGDVHWVRVDGSGLRAIASTRESNEHSPQPSPTRDEVVLVSDRFGRDELLLASLADGTWRRLTEDPDAHAGAPRWSPDGERIVYTRRRAGAPLALRVVDRRGETLLEIADGAMPDWMPAWR